MTAPASRGLLERLKGPFVAGVLGLLPLAITLRVLAWMVVYLHDLVGPQSAFGSLLRSFGLSFVSSEVLAYLIGFVSTFALVYTIGLLLQSGLTNRWQRLFETTVQQLPVVATIYDASKHLRGIFDRRDEDMQAMTPVLCRFGGAGGAAALALMPSPERIRIDERDYHVVIVPTAPVPFSGALLYVPAEWVQPAAVSVGTVLSVYMSMGASSAEVLLACRDRAADDRAPRPDAD